MRNVIIAITAFLLSVGSVNAAGTPSNKPLSILTGAANGTYFRIGQDIAEASKSQNLNLEVKESQGSVDNIRRINSPENASLGIVQSDLLGYLRRSQDAETLKLAKNLRLVFPLYKEEVHVLARTDIKQFSDLNGKRVAIGEQGSGHWLTSMNLFAMFGIQPSQSLRLPPAEAVAAVLQNKADAMIFVGGKPVKLFVNLQDLSKQPGSPYAEMLKQVHFLPLDDTRLQNEYAASTISPTDYNFIAQPVATVAVRAMLISYDFSNSENSTKRQRCEEIGKTSLAIKTQMAALQSSGHEKWKEVSLDNINVGLWERDSCADSVAQAAPANDVLEKDLLNIIDKRW